MKKISLVAALALALATSSTAAMAATSQPKPHVSAAAGAEGTAKHEMAESSATQQNEAMATPKPAKSGAAKVAKKHAKK